MCIWRCTLGPLLWSTYTLFHYKIHIELSKKRFYWIKGWRKTTLFHAYSDNLHGPRSIFFQISIEFQRLDIQISHNFVHEIIRKFYDEVLFYNLLGISSLDLASEWTHVCKKKPTKHRLVEVNIAFFYI
jgi:hypothetical protein